MLTREPCPSFTWLRNYKTGEVFGIKFLDEEKTRLFRDRFKGMKAPTEGEIGMTIDHPLVAKTIQYGKTRTGQEYIFDGVG